MIDLGFTDYLLICDWNDKHLSMIKPRVWGGEETEEESIETKHFVVWRVRI